MISYKSKFKFYWDIIILILAIFNSFLIPFEQAFLPVLQKNATLIIVDTGVEIMFLLDIIFCFFTSVLNLHGSEDYNSRYVAYRYTRRAKFYFDILACLGAEVFIQIS
jgi:predicted MPP superfamily phosphohydrolase